MQAIGIYLKYSVQVKFNNTLRNVSCKYFSSLVTLKLLACFYALWMKFYGRVASPDLLPDSWAAFITPQ